MRDLAARKITPLSPSQIEARRDGLAPINGLDPRVGGRQPLSAKLQCSMAEGNPISSLVAAEDNPRASALEGFVLRDARGRSISIWMRTPAPVSGVFQEQVDIGLVGAEAVLTLLDGNIVSNGDTHGIYCALHAVLEPGGGVIGPDPTMPWWAGRERCGPTSASIREAPDLILTKSLVGG